MQKRTPWTMLLMVLALGAAPRLAAAGTKEPADRLVLAIYYPWYHAKKEKGKSQWDDMIDHPLIGPYNSLDPKLLDYHFALARDCGIDALVSSWGFQGDRTDAALGLMLERLSVPGAASLKAAVYYETMLAEGRPRAAAKIVRDFVYILQKHGAQPNYLKADGKPVIFVYTAAAYPPEEWQEIIARAGRAAGPAYYVGDTLDAAYLAAFDALHTYDNVYVRDEDLEAAYRAIAQAAQKTKGRRLVATVIGGGRRVQKLGFDIDRSAGKFLRNRLRIARDRGAHWIVITTFNEWYEARQIEPSQEYGFEQIKYVRELAAAYKETPLAPLKAAALSATCQRIGLKYELALANTGQENVYCCLALSDTEPPRLVAYVLCPGAAATALLDAPCRHVSGFLADATRIDARP